MICKKKVQSESSRHLKKPLLLPLRNEFVFWNFELLPKIREKQQALFSKVAFPLKFFFKLKILAIYLMVPLVVKVQDSCSRLG